MLSVLKNLTYRHMFLAQVLSLLGTGLTTVALGLLAYDLAGEDAGVVLGTAFALKMVAYVGVAPIAASIAETLSRRQFLVALDLLRAGMVVFLPFVTEVWQVYVLVFLFQSCSAAFTPTFQATIPDILDSEDEYPHALSLSRLAYDLEALISPLLAGVLLTVMSFHWLFIGNVLGFLASAALVVSVALPVSKAKPSGSFVARVTKGMRIYLQTPRLRGLLCLSFVVSAAGSMVLVNTVMLVREAFGGSDQDVALFLSIFGLGSMSVALALPRVLQKVSPRPVMLLGGGLMASMMVAAALAGGYVSFMVIWCILGMGWSLILTPAGLLLRRSSHSEDLPALFAAQFALSHGCWLLAYPAAGWLGAAFGLSVTFWVMAVAACVATGLALIVWPSHDPEEIWHDHAEGPHSHRFVIDDEHRRWPKRSSAK